MLFGCGVAFEQVEGEGGPTPGGSGSGGGAAGGGGATGAPAEGGARSCPTELPGPALIRLDTAGETFCIDETEVTAAHYAEFLASAPTPDDDDVTCGFNVDYGPHIGAANCLPIDYDPVERGDHPVACVDWCDARDYCAWAGKRLCGAIGGEAGDFDAFADPSRDEWMAACSRGGERQFPYGNEYDLGRCVGDEFDGVDNGPDDHPHLVREAASCEGGWPGLFGMSGNVWEWTNACQDGSGAPAADTRCRLRGGSFWDDANALRCDSADYDTFTRSFMNKNHGFRCCSDPR